MNNSIHRNIKNGDYYRHFKGNWYQIICIAKDHENGKLIVVYRALYGDKEIYNRDISDFLSERDVEKYPQYDQKYRFSTIEEISQQNGYCFNSTMKLAKEECYEVYKSILSRVAEDSLNTLFNNLLDIKE